MKKYLIALGIFAAILPGISFAAIATDYSSYTAPATINYSGASGVNNLFLYLERGGAPVCSINYNMSATGTINGNCSGGGSFDGTITGDYQFLETYAANCFSSSYTACLAANGSSYTEADFSIATENSPTTSTAGLSYPTNPPMNETGLFMLLGIGSFFYLAAMYNHQKHPLT